MTFLDMLTSATSLQQVPAAAEPSVPALEVAKPEEPKVEETAAAPAPAVEDVAATTVVEPLSDDVSRFPSFRGLAALVLDCDSEKVALS